MLLTLNVNFLFCSVYMQNLYQGLKQQVRLRTRHLFAGREGLVMNSWDKNKRKYT